MTRTFRYLVFVLLGSCTFGDFSADAGAIDASVTDASVDAPQVDGSLDAAPLDAAPLDAAIADATPPDASAPDAQPFDAGPHAIGPLGAGLSTLVGDSAAGLINGPREFSLFDNPVNVLVGPDGDIFVADFNNGAIRRVTIAGDTTTLVHQQGFNRPYGMAFTPSGEFFVQTDTNVAGDLQGALYQVALDTGVATLRIDNSGRVRGMASLSDGRIVLANPFLHTLSIYNPADDSVVALAGSDGLADFIDDTGAVARFNRPVDVVVTSTDEILVSDSLNHRIRRVTLAGVVTTVAGDGINSSSDGAALSASFSEPTGLALADDATLYVCEFGSGRVRQLVAGNVSTIAGSTPGFADNVDPLQGQLHICEGMDFGSPHLYISDGNGGLSDPFHRVRRLDLTP